MTAKKENYMQFSDIILDNGYFSSKRQMIKVKKKPKTGVYKKGNKNVPPS